MMLLAIESATEHVGVAIGGRDGVLASIEVGRGRRHAETVAPAVAEVCRLADVTLADLDAVAVDVGPGLFTGMRVGIASAQAFARALRIPVVGVSSLEVLASPFNLGERTIVPVVDARKGEVFWSVYRPTVSGDRRGVRAVVPARCTSVDTLIAEVAERREVVLCVGDGALRHRGELLDGLGAIVADATASRLSVAALLEVAVRRALHDGLGLDDTAALSVEPLYLRLPDAQINWATRNGAIVADASQEPSPEVAR